MKRWQKIAAVLYWLATPMIVAGVAQIVSGLPFTLTNGTVADATQVMADFNQIVNNVNANGAKNGVNSDITALTALSTPLTVTQGGTGLATLTASGILYGAGTGTVGSSRCTMDVNSVIACTSATSTAPQWSATNTTADASSSFLLFNKNRSGGNSGNADQFGQILFRGFANSAVQPAADFNCVQNGAAVGSNIPSLCTVQTSTTAGQLNISFAFPPTSGTSGQYLAASGSGVTAWTTTTGMTTQYLISGTGATYTTPANARAIKIRMIAGGGGGGAANTNAGSTGGTTTFNSINAVGGSGGQSAATVGRAGGIGGTGGTGSASQRLAGSAGGNGSATTTGGGNGGSGIFGAGAGLGSPAATAQNGNAAAANTGAGGGGATTATTAAGGGGAGEYVEIVIAAPAASYVYTIGAVGNGGAAGTNAGGNGGTGLITVEEYY